MWAGAATMWGHRKGVGAVAFSFCRWPFRVGPFPLPPFPCPLVFPYPLLRHIIGMVCNVGGGTLFAAPGFLADWHCAVRDGPDEIGLHGNREIA